MRVRNCWPVVLGCLALTLSSCSTKPAETTVAPPPDPIRAQGKATRPARPAKEEIVGKWQRTDPGKDRETLTVDKNGDITKGEPGYEIAGKYRFLDDNTLEFEAKRAGSMAEQRTQWTVNAQPDTLTVKVLKSERRADDIDSFRETSDDTLLKGTEEHYKRVQ